MLPLQKINFERYQFQLDLETLVLVLWKWQEDTPSRMNKEQGLVLQKVSLNYFPISPSIQYDSMGKILTQHQINIQSGKYWYVCSCINLVCVTMSMLVY